VGKLVLAAKASKLHVQAFQNIGSGHEWPNAIRNYMNGEGEV